jgi:hypothetical protein
MHDIEDELVAPVAEVVSEGVDNLEPFWMRYLDLAHVEADPMWERMDY